MDLSSVAHKVKQQSMTTEGTSKSCIALDNKQWRTVDGAARLVATWNTKQSSRGAHYDIMIAQYAVGKALRRCAKSGTKSALCQAHHMPLVVCETCPLSLAAARHPSQKRPDGPRCHAEALKSRVQAVAPADQIVCVVVVAVEDSRSMAAVARSCTAALQDM